MRRRRSAAVAARLAREPEVEYVAAEPLRAPQLDHAERSRGSSQQWNFERGRCPARLGHQPRRRRRPGRGDRHRHHDATGNVIYRLWTGQRFENVVVPYRVNPDLDAARFAAAIDTTFTRLVILGAATQPVFDTDGHGTHVAGTILQSTNNRPRVRRHRLRGAAAAVKSCFSYWDFQFYVSALGEPGFVSSVVRRRMCDRRRRRRHPRRRRRRRQGHQPQPRRSGPVAGLCRRHQLRRAARRLRRHRRRQRVRGRQPDRVPGRLRRRRSPARCRSARSAAACDRAFYSNTGSSPRDRRAGRRFA